MSVAQETDKSDNANKFALNNTLTIIIIITVIAAEMPCRLNCFIDNFFFYESSPRIYYYFIIIVRKINAIESIYIKYIHALLKPTRYNKIISARIVDMGKSFTTLLNIMPFCL